jgi:amino acid transporter
MVVTPNQLTAAALVVLYWLDAETVNPGIWITVFMILMIGANYWGSRFLGQYEFFLSSFKITVVLGLMVLSLVLALGGGPDHDRKGFRYWVKPGAFAGDATALGRFRAVCRTIPSAMFAYVGSELIGISILHTRNPRKAAVRATKVTFYRILVINIVTVILLGMLVPYDASSLEFARMARTALKPRGAISLLAEDDREPTSATASSAAAFVVAMQMSNVAVLPHILNACFLLFVLSAANHALCTATRTLYGLSLGRNAFRFLSHVDRRGVPVYTLLVCSAVASLAYLNIQEDSKLLFDYFVNLVTMFSVLTWISILVVHIMFVRARTAEASKALTFKAPFGVVGSWVALTLCVLITFARAFDIVADPDGTFDYKALITSYIGIPLYLALIIGYKLVSSNRRAHQSVELQTLQHTTNENTNA